MNNELTYLAGFQGKVFMYLFKGFRDESASIWSEVCE